MTSKMSERSSSTLVYDVDEEKEGAESGEEESDGAEKSREETLLHTLYYIHFTTRAREERERNLI